MKIVDIGIFPFPGAFFLVTLIIFEMNTMTGLNINGGFVCLLVCLFVCLFVCLCGWLVGWLFFGFFFFFFFYSVILIIILTSWTKLKFCKNFTANMVNQLISCHSLSLRVDVICISCSVCKIDISYSYKVCYLIHFLDSLCVAQEIY